MCVFVKGDKKGSVRRITLSEEKIGNGLLVLVQPGNACRSRTTTVRVYEG